MLAFWGAVEVRHGLGWATKGPLWTACLLRLVALLLVSVILLLLACAFFSPYDLCVSSLRRRAAFVSAQQAA